MNQNSVGIPGYIEPRNPSFHKFLNEDLIIGIVIIIEALMFIIPAMIYAIVPSLVIWVSGMMVFGILDWGDGVSLFKSWLIATAFEYIKLQIEDEGLRRKNEV